MRTKAANYQKFYYLKITDDNIWLTSFQTVPYAYIERSSPNTETERGRETERERHTKTDANNCIRMVSFYM